MFYRGGLDIRHSRLLLVAVITVADPAMVTESQTFCSAKTWTLTELPHNMCIKEVKYTEIKTLASKCVLKKKYKINDTIEI